MAKHVEEAPGVTPASDRTPVDGAAPSEGLALSRREFMVGTLAAGAMASLSCSSSSTSQPDAGARDAGGDVSRGDASAHQERKPDGGSARPSSPFIFIAIDSLAPEYLALNQYGDKGGRTGDWLMPKVRAFLDTGTHFANARCFLPAATDMNHLNVVSGTSSGETGVLGISWQAYKWNPTTKEPEFLAPHSSWAVDENGTKVQTIFRLVKQKWSAAKTAYISGKAWIADMYRKDASGFDPGVDLVVSTTERPPHVPDPTGYVHDWYDPDTDVDAECDAESAAQKFLVTALPALKDPKRFTPDRWTVDAALAVLQNDQPDAALILLAETDDAQHALGTAWDPDEFEKSVPPYTPPLGKNCPQSPTDPQWQRWQLVSKRNLSAAREPILDQIRDVDHHFGRLIEGIGKIDRYQNATIVLYSDHSHVTQLMKRSWSPGDVLTPDTDFIGLLRDGGVLTEDEADGKGFGCYSGTSLGILYFYPDAGKDQKVQKALPMLRAYQAENPQTKVKECPWDVVGPDEMKNGLAGVCAPDELHHKYLDNSAGRYPVWPDIILLCKNGWQTPAYKGKVGNVGVDLPEATPPIAPLFGGHAGPDTQRILMAIRGPGVAKGKVITDDPKTYPKNYRIADLPVTVAAMYGLAFPHRTVGQDRRPDLT